MKAINTRKKPKRIFTPNKFTFIYDKRDLSIENEKEFYILYAILKTILH